MEEAHFDDRINYDHYAAVCRCGMRTILAMIENLKDENEMNEGRNFYHSIHHRIKCWESVSHKLEEKGVSTSLEDIKANVRDVAGIRVITIFEDDIYRVRAALERQPNIEIIEERDYVQNPKPNGYKSLHLIVNTQVYFCSSTKTVPVEIQIRDVAMDLWATTEHGIQYKNDTPSKNAPVAFKQLEETLSNFDKQAIALRDQSTQQQ